ncbi:MAG TPA: DUF4124 domain-containing protein [Burkholderiales bacterium]|jgi:hypothetical protein
MKPVYILFAAALSLPTLGSAETVFKWVDANGVTNYTTTPPPANVHKVSAVNASPAINNLTAPTAGTEEALYWRERRQRELASEISAERSRRENDDLRQQMARQQMASSYDDDQRRRAEEQRTQAAFDQCMIQRRIDCVYGNDYSSGYGVPVVVATRHRFNVPPTRALPGQRSLTNPTPGAPFIPVPPRPVQRPVLGAKLGPH